MINMYGLTFFIAVIHTVAYAGGQQYFRTQPKNTIAREGDDIMLNCEVANLAGAVQWTKDGFALGFSPVIPGFPRYSVVGARQHGEFNLRISNASLEDDGEFQCQVGPARFNKAIRANASLNIISPPSSIEIVNHPSKDKIEIKENQELQLECHVRNSKPAARIVWYRGNVELNIDKRDDQTKEVGGPNPRLKRYDVWSRITLKPTAEDDYAEYTCEARHEALPADQPMRKTVQLSVLYPPGAPYIEGYTEGETIRRGQTVELVCRSRGGNPPAQLIWYKNGEQIRMAYRTAGRVSENVYTFTADASDNKARYKCEASNVMSAKPLKAEIDLSVHFSPSHVTITGPTEARVGEPVPLTCTTANSNPPAEIKWMVAGRQLRNATSRTVVSPEGGWITTSNITVLVEPNRRSLVVICHGLNMQLTENVVSTHTINVLFPPSAPIIQGYVEGTAIAAGSVQKMSCISSGGNPLATLTWYKNDKKINSIVKTSEKSVSSEITILTNATDNEAVYKCEAANPAMEIPLFETVTMSVNFAPDHVKIRRDPSELKPNEQATLTCDSSSSNPPARLSWWRDGIPIQGLYNTTKPGLHGGKVSTIELKLNITEELNGVVYTCQAMNEALKRSVHDATTLQVLYKPVFEPISELTIGIENEPLIITLKADGNPMSIAYTWTKDGLPIAQANSQSGDRIVSDGPTLNITRLSRHDAGTYTCEAINSQGSNVVSVNISVEYPATITSTSDNVIASPGEDATLSCTAEGNPLTDETITWKRDNYPDMDTKTMITYVKNGTSYLRIGSVTRDDLGYFQCVVNNGIGNQTVKDVLLIVKHKPEIDMSPALVKFASDAGNTGRLVCRAKASPPAKFTWSRNGSPISANATGKYFTTWKAVDALMSESILLIAHVTAQDYGAYECVARNELGFSTSSPRLEVTSAPDAPDHFTAINMTHDSVTLTWTPGFDGGMKAGHRIRYRELPEVGYKYIDVLPYNATKFTVSGLEIDTEYVFSIMAFNKLGESKYLPDLLTVKTSNKVPPSYHSPSSDEKGIREFPGLLIIVGTICGTGLILLNILVVGCCLHRRTTNKNRLQEFGEAHHMIPDVLLEKQDLPKMLVISVGIVIAVLVVVNIILVVGCVFKKRAKRIKEQTGQNSKSATIEMYAPSSYNDTVTGETLSSVSEKSETYSNEGSNQDYVEEGRKQAASTYLMDQPEYPGTYSIYPGYEMQLQPAHHTMMPGKTHTLPHPHHHHHHHHNQMHQDKTRTRDDQALHYNTGTMSAKSSYMSAPSPAPPADGSYYNMSDRYLSYPPPLEYNPQPTPPMPPMPSLPTQANGSLTRSARIVPPPDVLRNTGNGGPHQHHGIMTVTGKTPSTIGAPSPIPVSAGYHLPPTEHDGHLV